MTVAWPLEGGVILETFEWDFVFMYSMYMYMYMLIVNSFVSSGLSDGTYVLILHTTRTCTYSVHVYVHVHVDC